jgi:plastocyanin
MPPGSRVVVLAGLLVAAVPASAATNQVTMQSLEISPAVASAKVGDTVEWINNDFVAHTATARDGDFDVMLPPKKSASFVLKKAGSFDYYCRFHPNMKASLQVEP